MKLISIIIFFVVAVEVAQAVFFTYKDVKAWDQKFPQCAGKRQSPIDIVDAKVKKIEGIPLKLQNFDKEADEATIENTGHTVKITLKTKHPIRIEGGFYGSVYEFNGYHFHWGRDDKEGSEDSVQGKLYPMQVHVLFYKKEYGGLVDAFNHDDGILVLGFFFKLSKKPNPKFEKIVKSLETIIKPNSKTTINGPITLISLIPRNLGSSYYAYKGSLTTPPCSEVVLWEIFTEPIEISSSQISEFRKLRDLDDEPMTSNFRPTQPIGDRTVWQVYSSSSRHTAKYIFIVLTLIIIVIQNSN